MLILRWLASQVLKGREILSLALLVGLGLWMTGRPESAQRALRGSLTGSVLFPVQAVVSQLHVRWGLEKQIESVQRDNVRLATENVRLAAMADMRQELREFEPLRNRLEFPFVGARVVNRNPLRLGGIWVVDVGVESDVREGMAVISPIGLVGRIISSDPGHSKLQTLADPDCRVAVLSSRSKSPGILHSVDGSEVFVEYSATSDIQPGDSLVTWGAGGIFPRGLPVGRVTELIKTPAIVLRNARVRLFQDPWTVQDVFVLLRPPSLRVVPDTYSSAATLPKGRR